MSHDGSLWARHVRGVCPSRKALLLLLGEHHNHETGRCFPAQKTLARDACMTVRTAGKYLAMLEADGLIDRRKESAGSGVTTHYTLNFARLQPQAVDPKANTVSERPQSESGFIKPPSGKRVPVGGEPKGKRVHIGQSESPSAPKGSCVPVQGNRKQPELSIPDGIDVERAKNPARDAFDELWAIWPPKGRQRSKAKSKVLDQLRKSCSSAKVEPQAIVIAAKAWLRTIKPEYAPALDRWLRDGRFEHCLPSIEQGATATNWRAEASAWLEGAPWRPELGPAPDQAGFAGPVGMVLEMISDAPDDHPVIRGIRNNLKRQLEAMEG